MPDPRLKTYAPQAVRHLAAAGKVLVERQEVTGARKGNVPPWPEVGEGDFHGTLSAIWIWARHQRLSGASRFAGPRNAAWTFVEGAAASFLPAAVDSAASDEAAYDCAMTVLAGAAELALGGAGGPRQAIADRAARVLATHLGALEDLSGREFRDPGFLAYALLEYGRAVADRGLVASGRKFVERAFGMKPPARFVAEPSVTNGLFDFSSTTATRILAVMNAEGNTPFVGAWLRERVAASVSPGFLPRRLDENCWNACMAWALGRAYVISTDPSFMEAYSIVMDELDRRDLDRDGAIPRDQTVRVAETNATFYYALAIDALVIGDTPHASPPEAVLR